MVTVRIPSYRKYKAERTNGYASGKEMQRAVQLRMWEKAGAICELREQVSYVLIPADDEERAIRYQADFTYRELFANGPGPLIVEDVKGFRTPVYKLKKRLMKHIHGITITEV